MPLVNRIDRRLLLSILGAPPRRATIFRAAHAPQLTRSISTFGARPAQSGYSISFGPELDDLLKKTASPVQAEKRPRTKKPKSTKKEGKARTTRGDNARDAVASRERGQPVIPTARPDILQSLSDPGDGPLAAEDAGVEGQVRVIEDHGGYNAAAAVRASEFDPQEDEAVMLELPDYAAESEVVNTTLSSLARKSQPRERTMLSPRAQPLPPKAPTGADGPPPKQEQWQTQKTALLNKFGGDGWNPRKKLSPDALEGIRQLHEQDPEKYSTPILSEEFKVSAEAIRRILKSKWRPPQEKVEERRERWAKRHDRIWDQQAEIGLRPQRKKAKEIEGPDEFGEALRARQILAEARS